MTRSGSKPPVRSAALAVVLTASLVGSVAAIDPANSHATTTHRSLAAAKVKATKEYAVIKTDFGTIKVLLFTKQAPKTVANFVGLVKHKVYPKRMIVERAVKKFVVQSGAYFVDSSDQVNQIVDQPTVASELGLSNTRGTLAMAHTGDDPDSAATAWFFNVKNNLSLDTMNGGFTVFGRITSKPGLKVLDKIANDKTVDESAQLGQAFANVPVQHLAKHEDLTVKNLLYVPKITITKK